MSCPFCNDAPTDSLDALLRDLPITYGHIQLFRDASGWQASVYHYAPKAEKQLTNSKVFDDPVEALRVALIEDERKTRDMERKYARAVSKKAAASAAKAVLPAQEDDDFGSMFE